MYPKTQLWAPSACVGNKWDAAIAERLVRFSPVLSGSPSGSGAFVLGDATWTASASDRGLASRRAPRSGKRQRSSSRRADLAREQQIIIERFAARSAAD